MPSAATAMRNAQNFLAMKGKTASDFRCIEVEDILKGQSLKLVTIKKK